MGTEFGRGKSFCKIVKEQSFRSPQHSGSSPESPRGPNPRKSFQATTPVDEMKRSASASLEVTSTGKGEERKAQSVQRKKSSKSGVQDDYPSPIKLKKEGYLVPEPLSPLTVNKTSTDSLSKAQVEEPAPQRVPEERLPTGVEPNPVVEMEYVKREDLKELEKVEEVLETILQELESKEWIEMCHALNNVRCLAVYHPNECSTILSSLLGSVLKLVKNPRSSVCKTAVLCLQDLIYSLKDEVIPFLDGDGMQKPASSLLYQLFLKACIDKQFVVEEVQKCLEMIGNMLDMMKMMELLIPYTQHKNPKVRGKAGGVLVLTVKRIPEQESSDSLLSRLLKVAAKLITDRTPDARESAKELIKKLHSVFKSQFTSSQTKQADGVVDVKVTATSQEAEEEADKDSYLSYSDDEEEEEQAKEKPPSAWKSFCEEHLTKTQVLDVIKLIPE